MERENEQTEFVNKHPRGKTTGNRKLTTNPP